MAGKKWAKEELEALRRAASAHTDFEDQLAAFRAEGFNRSVSGFRCQRDALINGDVAIIPRPSIHDKPPSEEDLFARQMAASQNKILLLEKELKNFRHRALTSDLHQATLAMMREEMQSLAALRPLVPIKPIRSKIEASDQTAVLCLSDWHGGEVVDREVVQGANEYNLVVFSRRMRKLAIKVAELLAFQRAAGSRIDKLIALVLGDMVSGMIHDELLRGGAISVPCQVVCVAHVLAQQLRDVAAQVDQVEARCIVGNHGRTSKEYGFKSPRDSFDYLVYEMAAAITRDIPNLTWTIHNSWFGEINIRGHWVAYCHGDGSKSTSYAGIPFYAILAGADKVFQRYAGEQGIILDLLVQGHTHIDANLPGVVMNGSPKGLDELTVKSRYRTLCKARQRLFGVTDARVLSFDYPIDLQDPGEDAYWIPYHLTEEREGAA